MSLYPRYYELKVCPVCRELVEEDDEMGARHWHRGYHGDILPVTITIEVPERVEQAVTSPEVRAMLAEKVAKQERWDAQLDWWRSLSQEERDRREVERRAKLSPMALALEDMMLAEAKRFRESVLRQPFSVEVNPVPPSRPQRRAISPMSQEEKA